MFDVHGWHPRQPILLLLLLISTLAQAQNNDEQLAKQYYDNGEYAKAGVYFDLLLDKNPTSIYFYENLLSCYTKEKQIDQALKLCKRLAKKFKDQPVYAVDGAMLAKDEAAAKKQFDKLLKETPHDQEAIHKLAEAFTKRKLYEQALTTYKTGREWLHDPNAWRLEVGTLYKLTGNQNQMLDEYLEGLLINEGLGGDIQSNLQQYMSDSALSSSFKAFVQDKIRKHPEKEILVEMLIWYYTQLQDWNGAFTQIRALDKRYKQEGYRVLELAKLALSNRGYQAAANISQYVIDLGINGRFYHDAQILRLDAFYKKIEAGIYTKTDLDQLNDSYRKYFAEGGKNPLTAKPMKDYAYLLAYYLGQPDTASALLLELVEMQRISTNLKAEAKLLLGDIYVLTGEYYEPVLYYGQVDKDFKEEPLGQEAKFRNAKLSYYKGEFEWAQAQLDVLKTATTQLISNNSIELSLMIQENTGQDSTEEALSLFASTDLLIYQNRFAEAEALLDTIYKNFPQNTLSDDIQYAKSRIYRKQQKWDKALDALDKVYTVYGFDILADNALFAAAEIQEQNLGNKEKAKELYEQIFVKFPGSLYSVEARKRFRVLRGDQLN